MKRFLYTICLVVAFSAGCHAQSTQSPQGLKQYVPVLPSVREKFWQIDPNLGYAMKDVGNGVYVISDNGWQSAFLVTDAGVIVFDAPETFGSSQRDEAAHQISGLLAHSSRSYRWSSSLQND